MKQRGFTLIEVMIVVVIIVVMATMAIPNYTQWVANQNLRESISELKGNLQIARIMAMKTGGRVGVQFKTPNNNQYLLFSDKITPYGTRDPGDFVLNRSGGTVPVSPTDAADNSRDLEEGITFGPVQDIVFGASGARLLPVGTGVTSLSLQNGRRATSTLTITSIGEVL